MVTIHDMPEGYNAAFLPGASAAWREIQYPSAVTGTVRRANVILPRDYDETKKYPVLYLLHGIGGDEEEWKQANPEIISANLLQEKKAAEMIIVLVNVRARKDDRVPSDGLYTIEHFRAFDAFKQDLTGSLMPYMEANFPILKGREHTAIAGLSMGGRESLYIGLTMTDVFGYIGAFSPAFGLLPYTNNSVTEEGLLGEEGLRLPKEHAQDTLVMIVHGVSDTVVWDQPNRYHEVLERNGSNHVFHLMEGGHDFTVWSNGLYLFIKSIFGQREINPITGLDYPDPDVIRVKDVYYMVTTTMHFMPGCEILRSYDLVHWEHAAFVYDTLDSTPGQMLVGEQNIYGKGMWAASLRFYKDTFYVCFVANDTGKTYLYTAESIEGPWKKGYIEGFYHDCSLLFDDDNVYIAYGNKDIYITQLKQDLSGPLEGGLHRLAVSDTDHPGLGYEGTHFYKINGKYYLFFIHSLRDRWMRVEACFMSDSLEGEFTGGDILVDDRGYCGQGVAQGGIVDTPDGAWYGMLFQDHGAVGRIPVLLPVTWNGDYPVFGENGKIPQKIDIPDGKPEYQYEPLTQSDDFQMEKGLSPDEEKKRYGCFGLKSVWQFNHEPDLSLITMDKERGMLWMEAGKLCKNLTQAKNILTQRMRYPGCAGEVTVDASALVEGDYAGICALQGCYGMAAVTKRKGSFCIVMKSRVADHTSLQAMPADTEEGREWEMVRISQSRVRLRVEVDFAEMKDEAKFFYYCDSAWKQIGITQKLFFKMDHFTGCRFGLFLYATQKMGGRAGFHNFIYEENSEKGNQNTKNICKE